MAEYTYVEDYDDLVAKGLVPARTVIETKVLDAPAPVEVAPSPVAVETA